MPDYGQDANRGLNDAGPDGNINRADRTGRGHDLPPQDDRSEPQQRASLGPPSHNFDIIQWYPAHLSCQKYFLDHAQHDSTVQALCALINIYLPYQWITNPILSSRQSPNGVQQNPSPSSQYPHGMQPSMSNAHLSASIRTVSLVPYLRRLVVTGFDQEAVLHGFFGDDWRKGVGSIHECERRNYLFAAKSGGWANVKRQYDMGSHETVPFLQPPRDITLSEIENAEKTWSQWLAMEDWMVGPRAPDSINEYSRRSFRSSQNSFDNH